MYQPVAHTGVLIPLLKTIYTHLNAIGPRGELDSKGYPLSINIAVKYYVSLALQRYFLFKKSFDNKRRRDKTLEKRH